MHDKLQNRRKAFWIDTFYVFTTCMLFVFIELWILWWFSEPGSWILAIILFLLFAPVIGLVLFVYSDMVRIYNELAEEERND